MLHLIAVFGSKSIRFFHLNVALKTLTATPQNSLLCMNEWIKDIRFLYSDVNSAASNDSAIPNELAVLFANNSIQIWNVTSSFITEVIQRPHCCFHGQSAEQSVLYSGRFFGSTRSELFFASGTVFHGALITKLIPSMEMGAVEASELSIFAQKKVILPIWKRFQGHDVTSFVIFT